MSDSNTANRKRMTITRVIPLNAKTRSTAPLPRCTPCGSYRPSGMLMSYQPLYKYHWDCKTTVRLGCNCRYCLSTLRVDRSFVNQHTATLLRNIASKKSKNTPLGLPDLAPAKLLARFHE